MKPIYKLFLFFAATAAGLLAFKNHSTNIFSGKIHFFAILLVLLPFFIKFFGITNSLAAAAALRIGLFLTGKSIHLIPTTFYVPTLVYAFCWNLERKRSTQTSILKGLISVVLPIFCIILFFSFPGVELGALYSLYWLIPPTIFTFQTLYEHSHRYNFLLTVTRIAFIQHAVGSIFWLYLFPITPEKWLALIPVVATEKVELITSIATLNIIISLCRSATENWQELLSIRISGKIFQKRKSSCNI